MRTKEGQPFKLVDGKYELKKKILGTGTFATTYLTSLKDNPA
jgi:hypothetical protein